MAERLGQSCALPDHDGLVLQRHRRAPVRAAPSRLPVLVGTPSVIVQACLLRSGHRSQAAFGPGDHALSGFNLDNDLTSRRQRPLIQLGLG
jgi:hypothetical protein